MVEAIGFIVGVFCDRTCLRTEQLFPKGLAVDSFCPKSVSGVDLIPCIFCEFEPNWLNGNVLPATVVRVDTRCWILFRRRATKLKIGKTFETEDQVAH